MEGMTYEYGTDKKRVGRIKLLAFLLVAFYIIFTLGVFWLLCRVGLVPLCAVLPLFLWMLVFFTWRYVQIEYLYHIRSGHMTVYKRLGSRVTKQVADIHIKEAVLIAPLEEAKEQIKAFSPKKCCDARPDDTAPDGYALLYCDERGERALLLFQATSAALRTLHYYNEKTVVTTTLH